MNFGNAAVWDGLIVVVTVTTGSDLPCYKSQPLSIHASSGYLASVVTERTGRGSTDCPWLIRAESWQRINVTLLDFSASSAHGPGYKVSNF